jgi:hypothetical protein
MTPADMPTPTEHQLLETIFEKCVIRRGKGRQIDCKLGLWGVGSRDKDSLERNARHYWIQYYRDGEYDKILGSNDAS